MAPASPWRSTFTLMPVAFVNASSTGFDTANASWVSNFTVVPRRDAALDVGVAFDDDESHAASAANAQQPITTAAIRVAQEPWECISDPPLRARRHRARPRAACRSATRPERLAARRR